MISCFGIQTIFIPMLLLEYFNFEYFRRVKIQNSTVQIFKPVLHARCHSSICTFTRSNLYADTHSKSPTNLFLVQPNNILERRETSPMVPNLLHREKSSPPRLCHLLRGRSVCIEKQRGIANKVKKFRLL